jgi:hypothetical protein
MSRELRVWRYVATATAIALALSVVVNVVDATTVPAPVTLFLAGLFVATRIGITVLDPASSLAVLSPAKERAFRQCQVRIGLGISIALLLTLLVREVRESAAVWLLAPLVALPLVLFFRERVARW